MIPDRCITKVAAVCLPDHLATQPMINELGVGYIKQAFQQRGHPFDVRLGISHFPQSHIISSEGIFEELDFSGIMPTDYSNWVELTIKRSATIDGLLLWINLYTHPNERPSD